MPRTQKPIPAGPLFRRIGKSRGAAKAFAASIYVSEQVLSNWRRRNVVPPQHFIAVTARLKITPQTYLREAGVPQNRLNEPGAQYTIEADQLLEDFNALPDWLQEHIARKTAELRRYADALPPMMRDGMRGPPKDPARYAEWERDILEDMIKRKIKAGV